MTIHLTPKSSVDKVEAWATDEKGQKILRVKVRAVPEDGKANVALIKLLSKTFDVPPSKITLLRGATSRIKQIEIEGLFNDPL